ncbi:hypothetical protein M1N08_00805 [Dehalococcoidia bacterium]|nr:hypothetical protein [Dehalococcoidia bacterium]
MTLEEVIERIQGGLMRLEKRKGGTIMIDEEKKTEYSIEVYTLEDLDKRVSVNEDRAYIRRDVPGHPIYFDLILESKVDMEISIRSIRYRVEVKHVPLQLVDWKQGDKFATNALELRAIGPLPALGKTRITVPFNCYMCSEIPEENRWYLDGYIEFCCILGEFKRSFYFGPMRLNEEDWRTLFPTPAVEI